MKRKETEPLQLLQPKLNALINLNVENSVSPSLSLHGNLNSLVQVINNMISNSIQAYNGKTNEKIDLILKQDNNNLVISVKDYASGMSKEIQDKLFSEMITTKGKKGTGLRTIYVLFYNKSSF